MGKENHYEEQAIIPPSFLVPSLWSRLWARMIDDAVRLGLGWTFWFPLSFAQSEMDEPIRIHLYWVLLGISSAAIYEILGLVLFQTTLGKYLFNLKVESTVVGSEGKISCSQAFLRVLGSWFHFLFSWAPFVSALFRYDRRHWLDLYSETRVVIQPQYQSKSTFQLTLSQRRSRLFPVLGTLLFVFYFWTGIERSAFFLSEVKFEKNFVEFPHLDSDYKLSFEWEDED